MEESRTTPRLKYKKYGESYSVRQQKGRKKKHNIALFQNSTDAIIAALFSDRGLMVHLNGGG